MDSARSPRLLRRINSVAVMRHALEAGEFTASQAMKATSLTRATVLGVCTGLVDAGWLEGVVDSSGRPRGGPGRPAHRYRVSDRLRVAGVDADEYHLAVRIVDLAGRAVADRRVDADAHRLGRRGRVDAVRELFDQAMGEAGCAADDLLLTVVAVPAPVDADGLSPEGRDGYWPLMNAGFEDALPGRVVVGNDANLAALAEAGDLGGNTATLLTGERFGAGLVVDGRLLLGSHGGAGEMRVLDTFFDDPGGTSGILALVRRWAAEALADPSVETSLRSAGAGTAGAGAVGTAGVGADDVARAAAAGDQVAVGIVERISRRIARIALALASLLDVETVVLAGNAGDLVEPVLVRAREILASDFYPPLPRLVAGRLGDDVVVAGAVEHARSLLREDPLQYLS